jgi:predicted amidohydrolase
MAAAIQMKSTPDLDYNLQQAEERIEYAVRLGAELIGLPENFSFLGPDEQRVAEAEQISIRSARFLTEMALRFEVTLLGGGFPVPTGDGRVLNTATLVDSTGQEIARYEKMHLFDVDLPDGNYYRESATVKAGAEPPPVIADEDLGNLGLSICYDLRFPELYRHLSRQGAVVLLVPAAFTAYTGKDHWKVLLRARAIENTCYVLAPAQTGLHFGRRHSHGHAMIVDPWGVVISDAGDLPGVALALIEPERLAQVRSQLPSLKHCVLT